MAEKTTSSAILASLSPQETLDFLTRNGMIDIDDVRESIVDKERKKILKAHPYALSHGKDGRWRTWVPDKKAKDGRKKIAKSTKEKLEEAVDRAAINRMADASRKGKPAPVRQRSRYTVAGIRAK